MNYTQMSKEELQQALDEQNKVLAEIKKRKISLDISRGKPCAEQLDIAMSMLDMINSSTKFPKPDYRNYGIVEGIPELRALFGKLLGVDKEETIVCGNSSLQIMYDTIQRNMQFGVCGGKVETLVAGDDSIKGIWCIPKYQNPTGYTFSDETVERLAKMKTAAKDFRIFWDNAYCVHDLYEQGDKLANIMAIAKEAGTADRVYEFASTSKVTFAGGGVAVVAASKNNIADILSHMKFQTIGFNKVWQYAHYLYLQSPEHIAEIMAKQAAIIRPKFEKFEEVFSEEFGEDSGIAKWTKPRGGYFISLDVMDGCAKEVGRLCKSAGLTITTVGDTFPYGVLYKSGVLYQAGGAKSVKKRAGSPAFCRGAALDNIAAPPY